MPIAPSHRAPAPLADLGWKTTQAILAIEQLRRGRSIDLAATDSLEDLRERLEGLSKAASLGLDDIQSQEIEAFNQRTSFYELLAVQDQAPMSPLPEKIQSAASAVTSVLKHVAEEREESSRDRLNEAQAVLVELLSELNR